VCRKFIYLVSFALMLGLVSNVTGQIVTNATEDFETGDFSRFPWEHYGNANWAISSAEKNSGNYCAQAGSIEDDESTTLQVTLDCVSDNISFYCKVSSESRCDYLEFYIDGVRKGKWSGREDWAEVSFQVTAGTRTFEWVYSKDGSVSEGDDTAWIDDINFPLGSSSDGPGPLPLTATVEITTWQNNKPAACSFTFDDNQETQFTHFVPKFQDLGFVGTVFLVTGWQWHNHIDDYAGLLDSGWEIGSHTVSHPHLTELSSSSLQSELADSKATLEAVFNLPPGLTLAYPFAASNTMVRNMTAQFYIAARGGQPSSISPDMSKWPLEGYDKFNLPSYGWTASGHNLDAMNSATDSAISRGEWIVEMIHGTDGDGWEPPDWASVYEPHFDYVASRESDLWIDTFGNVYRYIAERDACKLSVQALPGGTAVVLTSESALPPTPVPLTIKIDIPDQWISVTVTDNDNVISGRIITENQNKYYLIDIIPTDTPKGLYVSGSIKLVESPFKRGVNLSDWLQASSARHINFEKFTKQDLINIKSLGCDVVRLPINLHYMNSGPPDYTIDPLFYDYLDQIIDWAEELELHLILDNHPPFEPTDPSIADILVPVWTQMARHYRNRSNLIYYEIMNEPHVISDTKWNDIQGEVIDAIRAVDQMHTIIVGATQWNSYDNLKNMPAYTDDNLIYTFHFYSPKLFTAQGVGPPNATLESVAGLPFPYDANRMPERPPEFVPGTWEWDRWENYPHEGTIEHVKELIDIAADFQRARNIPVFCGEFGVYIPNSDNEDRVRWYGAVRSYLEEKGIAWTMWDYKGPFHIFEKDSPLMFNHDLNVPLIEALGLTVPPQQEFILTPDTNGFDIYLDHEAPGIIINWWVYQGILDFYSQDNPASGYFCIHWAGIKQYHPLTFKFSPIRDLSLLVNRGYAIDFWIRCSNPGAKIDIRFVDTKTEERGDHPWRMRYTIDRNIAVCNGQWNHLQIPLSTFSEQGASDNGWYHPIGAFDWTAVECFEIVPEYGDLVGVHFYFDDIRVVDPSPAGRP
jgi:endoglucanase